MLANDMVRCDNQKCTLNAFCMRYQEYLLIGDTPKWHTTFYEDKRSGTCKFLIKQDADEGTDDTGNENDNGIN